MLVDFLYSHPTWQIGLLIVGVWTAVSVLGLVVFHRFVDVEVRHKDTETVGLTYAIVAVIYAVLIAVIVVGVWEAFAKGDEIAAAEANRISNLTLDAAGLPAAARTTTLASLTQYVQIVTKQEWPAQQAGHLEEHVFEPGWTVLGTLSAQLAAFEPESLGQNATKAELLHESNELVKARRTRILAAGKHLPEIIWQILLIAGGVAVFYTYLFGARSFGIHLAITGLISSTMALVFVLIVALDYPFRGEVSVSDEAYTSIASMTEGAAGPHGAGGHDGPSAPATGPSSPAGVGHAE